MNAVGKHAAAAGMRDVEILLHHRTGAADLVADHLAEIARQQAVDGVRDPVAFGFGLRRGVAGKRMQRRAIAPAGGDGFGRRESVVHRRQPPHMQFNNKMTARGGQTLLVSDEKLFAFRQRSCASTDSVAIGRASSRFSAIGSPVSSQ